MFTNDSNAEHFNPPTLAYNKARIELHAQAVRYNLATEEERENLPVGKLIPQEDITDELWGVLDSPLTPEQIEVSLTHNKEYPVPAIGLEITKDNVEWFIITYSEWLARVGLPKGLWGRARDGDRVTLLRFSEQDYFPWQVIKVTDEEHIVI